MNTLTLPDEQSSIQMIVNNNDKPAEGSFNEYGHELINNRWCSTDDDISMNLSYRIINNIKLTQDYLDKAQDSFYQVCVDLKRFKEEKRYKFFNYRNFEQCCEERFCIGIRQVQKYISIATNISYEQFQEIKNTKSTSPFSLEKYYILSRLTDDERTELISTTDIEHTSVKQLEQKSKEIKHAREVTKDDDTSNKKNNILFLEPYPPFELGKYFNVEIYYRGFLDNGRLGLKILDRYSRNHLSLDNFVIYTDQYGEYIIFDDTHLKCSGLDIDIVFKAFCVYKVENGRYYLRYYKETSVDFVQYDTSNNENDSLVIEPIQVEDTPKTEATIDVEEISQEHEIILHQDDTSNVVVPAPVSQNDITSSIDFKEFCKGVQYSGSRGRSAIDSTFTCYDGQDIKHNLLDYYTYFTKTLNGLLKSNMDSLDYEATSRQLSDLIEVSNRLGDTLYDVKNSFEREIDKKKRPYLYDDKYFNKNYEPNKE